MDGTRSRGQRRQLVRFRGPAPERSHYRHRQPFDPVTDSMGRSGTVEVTLAERDFDTVTPPEGRVGTLAVVQRRRLPQQE